MKKLLVLFILLFAVQLSAQQPSANSKKRPSAVADATRIVIGKINQFLKKQPGYSKVAPNIWTTPYNGKSLTDFKVFVSPTEGGDLVIFVVEIAKSKEMRLSQDLLYKILKYNNLADQIKAGINDEGDLILRADINGRLMDLRQFQSVLAQVAAAADGLHGQIISLLAPKAP
ncbi:MAG: hypothetical protein ABIU09_09050 [Pyrinomonadaceae bacterium]